MVLFPMIGLLLWIAFLTAVLVLCGALWVVGTTVGWFLDLAGRNSKPNKKPVSSRPSAPKVRAAPVQPLPPNIPAAAPPVEPDIRDSSGIWPKWTPSHRLYKDYELAHWQEQFDALNARS